MSILVMTGGDAEPKDRIEECGGSDDEPPGADAAGAHDPAAQDTFVDYLEERRKLIAGITSAEMRRRLGAEG